MYKYGVLGDKFVLAQLDTIYPRFSKELDIQWNQYRNPPRVGVYDGVFNKASDGVSPTGKRLGPV